MQRANRPRLLELAAVALIFAIGFALRLRPATIAYLNPDEAFHALNAFGTLRHTLHQAVRADAHPPLVALILYVVGKFSRTEIALRMPEVIAGSAFPVLLWLWLRRIATPVAGFAALLLLTFSPALIAIGAVVRSYTPAFLLMSLALVLLESALDRNSRPLMASYGAALALCAMADFSTAWFIGGAFCYAALRLRGSSRALWNVWAAGQAAVLALYAAFALFQIPALQVQRQFAVETWLSAAFPARSHLALFPLNGTVDQFAYVLGSNAAAIAGLGAFALAIALLWMGRTPVDRLRSRPLAILLVLPFVLTVAAAYAHVFPYGRTRHTLVLGILGIIGISILIGSLPRRAGIAAVAAMAVLTPAWEVYTSADGQEFDPSRGQKSDMIACLAFMRANIPAEALIYTDLATLEQLFYYEGHTAIPVNRGERFQKERLGGAWRVVYVNGTPKNSQEIAADLNDLRRQYGMNPGEPVWVINGGWGPAVPEDPRLPFSKAVRVFRSGSE